MRRLAPLLFALTAAAQTPNLQPVPAFPLPQDAITLRRPAQAGRPFTVAGARGVVLGQGEGTFEQWVLPVKVLSHMTIEANVPGYAVPILLNESAAAIEVSPDHTTLTYAHIAFTLRQIMFSPDDAPAGTGAVVLFQLDSSRPVDLTFRFTPEMRPMWLERGKGPANAEWVKRGASGFYILHTDYPDLSGAVALPTAQAGILAPFQEKPQTHPLEFHLHYDPARDRDNFFPLLVAIGETAATASTPALEAKLAELAASLPALYATHASRYEALARDLTSLDSPDPALNADFRWAIASIEQLKARSRSGETGLVAGYYSSGDSARPGFGWFFGRDTLYTLTAIDSVGDFTLARQALEFLLKRQRTDGKMMHEFSQTAGEADWAAFPYFYASADGTPLFLTAMLDYVRSSGDLAFLRAHRAEVEKAWHFETTHDADGDGIYDNSEGTGWVESWPPGMPKQEIYMALLDAQASTAMSQLATLLEDPATAQNAATRATKINALVEKEYYQPALDRYAFSHNPDGTVDHTPTIYPTLAWWNGAPGLQHAEASLRHWNSHDFATDWGLRDVAESDPLYDPISYHQGSVWPLFTGWAAMANFRSGHPIAGYANLMQNANQTSTQDLGAVTELLSGAYFTPFGRSTSHQLWSSAMVITPTVRGLFGLDIDALQHTLSVTPHLPATWDHAALRRLHLGDSTVDLELQRHGPTLEVRLTHASGPPVHLTGTRPDAARPGGTLRLPLPTIEASLSQPLPLPGARTSQTKVLSEATTAHSLTLLLEAPGGTTTHLQLRHNAPTPQLKTEGATATADDLAVTFPPGTGYQQQTVTLRW